MQKETEYHATGYVKSLIEAFPDPYVAMDAEGKILEANSAFSLAIGIPAEQLIGTDFSTYINKTSEFVQKLSHHAVADYPLELQDTSGNTTPVVCNAITYRDENGRTGCVFVAMRDVSVQHLQESRIQALNEALEQRVQELESFSYSVSHDLRAPLRGVDGFIAMFLNKYLHQVDEEGQRLLGNVRMNVTRMGQLIDELLTLSRVGTAELKITEVNMTELAKAALEELNHLWGSAHVVVNDLGYIRGDVVLLRQVWVNLISNALQFSAKKEFPMIEIGCLETDQQPCFYIRDNGVGFDMEYANKLFGVFQRLHPPQEYDGVGVGLATVQRIIHRHGGKIWAEGKENTGATFYFTLKNQ